MFDFDAGKLLVIAVVALIVIGPKDLPRVMRQVGQAVAKLRRMAGEFQSQFMDAMREAELEEIRQDMAKLSEQATIDTTFNPVESVRQELTEALTGSPVEGAPALGLSGLGEAGQDFAAAAVAPLAEPVNEGSRTDREPTEEAHSSVTHAPPDEGAPADELDGAARRMGGR